MKQLYLLAFNSYVKLVTAHIRTKTEEPVFHEKSAAFYEAMFEVLHEIGEKSEDVGMPIAEEKECSVVAREVLDSLVSVKEAIEAQIAKKNSVGTDNLLRGLVDKLEFQIGNAKALVDDEEEEYETAKEEKRKIMK